jgi:hypothetical protein
MGATIPGGTLKSSTKDGEKSYANYSIQCSRSFWHSDVFAFTNIPELAGLIIKQKFIYRGSMKMEFFTPLTDDFIAWLRDCLKPAGFKVWHVQEGFNFLITKLD